jgi:hypothetical protein
LARRTFVGSSAEVGQREAASAFIDGVRDREIKLLLTGDKRPLKEIVQRALQLEAVKAAA